MNKLVIALVFIACNASAESYGDAQKVEHFCDMAGHQTQTAFELKGQHYSLVKIDAGIPKGIKDAMPWMQGVIDNAYNHATDAHHAYMMGWSKCMDNVKASQVKY